MFNRNDINQSTLTIITPCYNEEAVLEKTTDVLTNILDQLIKTNKVSEKSKILFVDDGSKDSTWTMIQRNSISNSRITGIKLSRNFGHQNALIAGMETARNYSDCIITIDADLQDDANVMIDFVDKYIEGYDIVYGVRKKREKDTFFKRNTALAFYRIMGKMGVNLVPDHADFRLMSKRVLHEFAKYQEENLFIRGIIPLLGFRTTKVYYDRFERYAGESKYPLKKMISFAIDGITSFSVAPIKVVTLLGFLLVFLGVFIAAFSFIENLMNKTVSGWTSLIISIWIIGGMQLIATGVIGMYIGKVFNETKERPRYIIEKKSN